MGKILLIEPYKILQQAVALSLSSDHEVQVEENIKASDIATLKDIDLFIVDAGALRERNQLSAEFSRAIQNCPLPTVWLDEEESSRPPKRDKLAAVMKPIEKEAFQAAVAGLLAPPSSPREWSKTALPPAPKEKGAKGRGKKQPARAPEQPSLQFIDLVEVVEEPVPKPEGKLGRKPK